jgi:hypothetical protein
MHTKAYEGISFDMSHKNLAFTTMQYRRVEMSYYAVNYSFELMKEIEEAPSGTMPYRSLLLFPVISWSFRKT